MFKDIHTQLKLKKYVEKFKQNFFKYSLYLSLLLNFLSCFEYLILTETYLWFTKVISYYVKAILRF